MDSIAALFMRLISPKLVAGHETAKARERTNVSKLQLLSFSRECMIELNRRILLFLSWPAHSKRIQSSTCIRKFLGKFRLRRLLPIF